MLELNNFDSIRIGLASPEKVRRWSRGEVKKPETINYRTLKPEKEGLFCEKIFGPTKDWECHCGKYKRVRYKGVVCDRCGVEVTKSKVRRERMGHIELAAPVSHIWYFKGIPSRMGLIMDMSPRSLEKILYFASYIVIDPGDTPLSQKQLLSEGEYREAIEKYGRSFRAGMGAEAVKECLANIDLEKEVKELRMALKESSGQKRVRIIRRLEVVEAFRQSGNRPDWMILDVIPVIPPDLRPMVQLDGGRFATSDLNDLYRRVINRNNRLKRLLDLGAPDIIVRNEKRMLQEAVDALIDNGRRGRPVTGPGNRPLKSLSDMLKGKQGRFRQNLLGKRVDYSGRSVIVVGPELKFYQCGLPKKMALELFKPFVMRKLVNEGHAHNIKSAKRMVEKVKSEVWDVLEEVIKEHPVLLNRAPTLHRLGIQAFEPVLVEGKAIKLHPLVCTAYNADFDGDQMAVHVPLSSEAQAEARFLMLATNNILAPKDGKPITTPTQDMVLGSYYLTIDIEGEKGEGKVFKDFDELLLAYYNGAVGLHAKVKMKCKLNKEDIQGKLVESTVGRFIFNENVPQDLGFVDRKKDPYSLEVDTLVDKKMLGKIIEKCFRKHGNTVTSIMLDHLKNLGFHFSTIGAMTISIGDIEVPDEKEKLLSEAEAVVDKYEKAYRRGLISDEERYEKVIEVWNRTTEKVTEALMNSLDRLNNVFIMSHSGARGSRNQIKQLAGMRGLMANASGRTVEQPIKSNFREGLTVLEFFISTHGSRKGNADTALRTADSGYLTRRLVDVSQDVIVREEDCGTDHALVASAFRDGKEVIEELKDRIEGRYSFEDITHPETGKIIVEKDERITEDIAEEIVDAGINEVKIRTVLGCRTRHGVCAKCYGTNLATGNVVNVGESVGIIAAQSIGEPGTQLTMRTFHTGGIAGSDITQGLPRVEELFEARKPKGLAMISEIAGTVSIKESKRKKEAIITGEDGESKSYTIPYGSRLKVKEGDAIEAGDELTEGSVNPHDILKIKGTLGVQSYLVKEVQRVYRMQGVDIHDKHIEVVVRQMLGKVKVEDSGDTDLLPGGLVNIFEFEEENKKVEEQGGEPATARRVLLGITKASLATESFLSAASFQETTRVLTEAAIKGKEDTLIGLKENVIIGKLIPAGTGMKKYKNIAVNTLEPQETDTEAEMEL
ncbi:MAG: DNA-directed RNA polymerase subunit beta' [Firmicutes bacterium]|nr:DNA-directed RNA polymerase subunit beta' [Bacillota bacterium]